VVVTLTCTVIAGSNHLTFTDAGGHPHPVSLPGLPPPLDTVVKLAAIGLWLALVIGLVLSVVFALVATAKAIFGTAWTYPFALDLVDRLE